MALYVVFNSKGYMKNKLELFFLLKSSFLKFPSISAKIERKFHSGEFWPRDELYSFPSARLSNVAQLLKIFVNTHQKFP